MEATLFRGNREPSLDQILAEPIVRTIMRRDGVDETTIRALMRKAASARSLRPFDLIAPAPPDKAVSDSPQASIGILAQAAAAPHWPRVFPSL